MMCGDCHTVDGGLFQTIAIQDQSGETKLERIQDLPAEREVQIKMHYEQRDGVQYCMIQECPNKNRWCGLCGPHFQQSGQCNGDNLALRITELQSRINFKEEEHMQDDSVFEASDWQQDANSKISALQGQIAELDEMLDTETNSIKRMAFMQMRDALAVKLTVAMREESVVPAPNPAPVGASVVYASHFVPPDDTGVAYAALISLEKTKSEEAHAEEEHFKLKFEEDSQELDDVEEQISTPPLDNMFDGMTFEPGALYI